MTSNAYNLSLTPFQESYINELKEVFESYNHSINGIILEQKKLKIVLKTDDQYRSLFFSGNQGEIEQRKRQVADRILHLMDFPSNALTTIPETTYSIFNTKINELILDWDPLYINDPNKIVRYQSTLTLISVTNFLSQKIRGILQK
ncbi:MAG: hypothetical protein L0207_04970 [Chlamydiae bacterium]|nr:hypothetical protein [Chlamydiota bacterium]